MISGTLFFLGQPLKVPEPTLFSITQGMSLKVLLFQLEQNRWIESSWVTCFIHHLKPSLKEIKVGTYEVRPHGSLRGLLKSILAGDVHQFSVTFIEGSCYRDWIKHLSKYKNVTHTITELSPEEVSKQIGLGVTNPEGLLFPETYYFVAGTKDVDILCRAKANLDRLMSKAWKNRSPSLPFKTPYEALILASIIEKETSIDGERKKIASVLINRLRQGIRLQTDPTVIYGMGDSYQGKLSRKNLQTLNPYNTYKIKGLPPTPIAMPGAKSVYAALQPAQNSDLYFVADGSGGHRFSETLSEHNRAVQSYIKKLVTS